MKLVKCKKCGTTICTDNAFLQRIVELIEENDKLAQRSTGGKKAGYVSAAASYRKMFKSFMHNLSRVEVLKHESTYTLWELKKYIRDNNLIDEETLTKISKEGKRKAEIELEHTEREIQRIYGSFGQLDSSKKDPTADLAIRNVDKSRQAY